MVVGTYTSWLVANSGRKEAIAAGVQIKFLEKKIEVMEKKLTEATFLASSPKKMADKAFAKGQN